jgi:hypothetical protein
MVRDQSAPPGPSDSALSDKNAIADAVPPFDLRFADLSPVADIAVADLLQPSDGPADKALLSDQETAPAPDAKGDGLVAADAWVAPDPFDVTQLLPVDSSKTLVFRQYGETAGNYGPMSVYEYQQHEWWPDKQHFTIHRYYGSGYGDPPLPPPACPRVDDVFLWLNDQLIYQQTWDFFSNASAYGPTLTEHTAVSAGKPQGQVWADRFAVLGLIENEVFHTTAWQIGNASKCTAAQILLPPILSRTNRGWRQLLQASAWSPYTGGGNNVVSVLRLDGTTWMGDNPDDQYVEKLSFYNDPQHGWLPIWHRIYRVVPSAPTVFTIIADGRLTHVLPTP